MNLRNPILEIAIALLLVVISLVVYSYSGVKMKVLSVDIKKPPIKDFLTHRDIVKTDSGLIAVLPTAKKPVKNTHLAVVPETPKPRMLDTTPQHILMIGESMIEGLMFPFMKYSKYNGHTLKAKIWYGSRLLDWGGSDTLKTLLNMYKPTFVIVSIGSNELFIRNIDEREPYVKNIVEQLGNYKFIWVGPPNPRKDNGINDLIMRNVGEDRFFVSKYMHFERKRDGVHPKADQCYKWADSISDWIVSKSRYPILLKRPELDASGHVVMPKPKVDTSMSAKKDSIKSKPITNHHKPHGKTRTAGQANTSNR